ncbi:Peroxidase 1 [Hordeum vulgare]|nr:Peroxidase 1 [Hordeum vulgare]
MPGAEGIVFRKTTRIAKPLPDQATSLLRLHYHDCFVQACDVSMLLDSMDGSPAEKDAMPNQSPRGMDVVARVKDKLGKSKGLSWLVALGRRNGRTSRAENCGRLPLLYGNITVMIKVFAAKGLDVKDLVMLSAAHTFGKEHCSSFADLLELYNGNICSTDTTLEKGAEARLFSADGYAGIRNGSGVTICSPQGSDDPVRAQDDRPKNKESDLLLFDWPELDDLEDLQTDPRKLDSAFEMGSDYFDDSMCASICSPDVQLVPRSKFDNHRHSICASVCSPDVSFNLHSSSVAFRSSSDTDTIDQHPSRKKGKETPLNSSSSSVEMEHFPRLSDADLLSPFFFHDMVISESSSIMGDNEIMSSSAARSGPDDFASAYSYVSTKDNQPRATPDMILEEMSGNPLDMYFPPFTTYQQPQVPMSGAASTLPEGFAGGGALKGAGLQFGSKPPKGSRSSGRAPSSIPEAAPAPVKHLGFQKLQEGMNQLDVGTKTCIRDALYRLASSVEHKHQVVEQDVGSSAANRQVHDMTCMSTSETFLLMIPSSSVSSTGNMSLDPGSDVSGIAGRLNINTLSVWAETKTNPMDRSVAQLLLQKPLDRRTADRRANHAA